ncbi:hypothetical protein [Methanococcoides seepicolus]|uniref:Uncharacterized protein n=1 Tax=Methanococcoides seepicolus TaxID=2828780 RepID=A0A9E4ZI96_9EURY|nr:hypothetical protein [Methanococcoides seepicolus]MCM1987494.1 hypothetical protein [Methanococcoides seepicolus]
MIKEILMYKRHFYRDVGIYLGIIVSLAYLFIFNPFTNPIKVFELRVWVLGISFSIIALLAVYCHQSHNSSKDIVNDTDNNFYELLLKNDVLDEIVFLYKWNVNIGVSTILVLVAYNMTIYSRLFNNTILGIIAVLPIFLVIWTVSEFRYSNQVANKLNKSILEYRKIHLK